MDARRRRGFIPKLPSTIRSRPNPGRFGHFFFGLRRAATRPKRFIATEFLNQDEVSRFQSSCSRQFYALSSPLLRPLCSVTFFSFSPPLLPHPLPLFCDPTSPVNDVTFHPDGLCVAACSSDNTIKIWDIRMNQLLQHYAAHQDAVNSISIHPSGDYMVSASSDMTTKVIHSMCMTYLIWERAAARATRRSIIRVGSNAGRGNYGGPIFFPSCVWTYPDDARLLRRGAPPGRAPNKYPHSCKPNHFSSNTHNTIPTTKHSRFGTCAKVTCVILYMAMSVACRPLPFHQPATILRPALQTRTY